MRQDGFAGHEAGNLAVKTRVMFLIYSLCEGGAQRALVNAANALARDGGFDVTVQALFHEEACARELSEKVHYRAAFSLRAGVLRKIISGFIQYVLPPRFVYRRLFCGNYDVEAAFMEAFPTKILAYSTNQRAKKYAWVHIDVNEYTKQDRLFRSRIHQKNCYRQFDKICCVSESVRGAFVQKFGLSERTCVLYNILDTDRIDAASAQVNVEIPRGKPPLVSAGSLIRRKGFARLVRICARLKREGVAFCAVVLGDGPRRGELEKLIQKEHLGEDFRLLGHLENPYPLMAAADVYVCPSHVEGFSTAVSEALWLGVPVAAADCAGMRELLGESEYGELAENNEEALYFALRRMLTQPERRAWYCEKSAERRALFSMETRTEAYKALLSGVERENEQHCAQNETGACSAA